MGCLQLCIALHRHLAVAAASAAPLSSVGPAPARTTAAIAPPPPPPPPTACAPLAAASGALHTRRLSGGGGGGGDGSNGGAAVAPAEAARRRGRSPWLQHQQQQRWRWRRAHAGAVSLSSHTVALRWCHTSGRDSPSSNATAAVVDGHDGSGGGESVAAEARVGPWAAPAPSTAAWHPCADAPAGASPRLDALLRRLQPTPVDISDLPALQSARRVAVAGGGARAAPTTAEEEYVPLLFRSDFHRANPHARRYTAAAMTESDADAPPRAPPVAVAATLQPTTAPPHTDDDRATAAAPPHVDGDEVACAAVVAPPTTGGASAAARGRSGRIILDPVEWLAQAPDTPLVDEATLRSCAPICEQLVYSPASCTVAAAAAAHAESLEAQDNDDDDDCDLRDAAPPPPESASAAAVATMAARGFDPATAAWMAAAAQQQQQQQCVDEKESTDLQAALEMDLYADVPRAVRLQQWQRPQRHKTRKRALRRNSPADTAVVADVPNTPVTAGAPLEDADEAPHVQQRSDAAPNATPRFRSSGMAEADTAVEGTPQPAPAAPAAAPAAVETEALVYNVFTRRVAKAGSMGVRALALMGIGVDTASRELRVVDEVALRRLATELRGHRVSWPQLWSRGSLYQQLERLLSDPAVENPVQRVVDVLQLQYNLSHQQRHQPGLVVGAGGEAAVADEAAAAAVAAAARMESTAAPPMSVESMDDKLLTVQDLNAEQQAVVQLVLQGHHTYIGGGAGTGKSVLLRVIKQQLAREGLAVAVTGTTGIAGSLIGGCTLHHCLGINLLGEFTRRKELSSYDVIIIDEVSMLSRHLFESLDVHLRRANNPNLPFGGVQMILSGDFLQLGAIDAQPLITSNVFRRNFVQLKLHTVVRQNGDRRFAAQLQQLRRGQVPHDLPNTVRFLSREEVVAEHKAAVELRARQQAQLQHVLLTSGAGADVHNGGPAPVAPPNEGAPPPALLEPVNATVMASPHKRNSSGRDDDSAAVGFVDGAVNLLPTNDEVDRTNTEQLARLEGELITYTPQFLPPSLVGHWSPTYVLRICNPAKLNGKTLALELQRHLAAFYTHGQRASTSLSSAAAAEAAAGASGFSDGSWLTQPSLGERSLVLYPLFVDALAFRVRLPPTIDKDEARQFLLYLNELDEHLQTTDHGVRVRDVLLHADGMHTEADEYTLSQYAERAPLARPLGLKVGARVMLRTNLAPGLVNGSLGTVVAFRRLEADQLPRYIIGNALRAASVALYADFLHYECGFAVPLVPVVDFGGRQEVIPPVTHYVGGLPNTHHYSMGIVALPLSLAYAFTVHKVQGLTLVGRVHLELSRMWPCEHLLYVAMSRVRNPEQLSVSSFYPGLVRAAADCLLFDDSLPPVTQARTAPHMIAATWRRLPEQRKKTLLRKRIEAFARQRQSRLQSAAKKGDIRAEIRLLEEKMLRRRTRASSATRHKS